MGWNSWAFGTASNQDSLYKAQCESFHGLDHIKLVQRVEQAETSTVQKKRLSYFLRYLASEYISKENASLSDKASNMEATATVTFEGKINSLSTGQQHDCK